MPFGGVLPPPPQPRLRETVFTYYTDKPLLHQNLCLNRTWYPLKHHRITAYGFQIRPPKKNRQSENPSNRGTPEVKVRLDPLGAFGGAASSEVGRQGFRVHKNWW
jgi:hypothetical protein